jgi:hypothetical protein
LVTRKRDSSARLTAVRGTARSPPGSPIRSPQRTGSSTAKSRTAPRSPVLPSAPRHGAPHAAVQATPYVWRTSDTAVGMLSRCTETEGMSRRPRDVFQWTATRRRLFPRPIARPDPRTTGDRLDQRALRQYRRAHRINRGRVVIGPPRARHDPTRIVSAGHIAATTMRRPHRKLLSMSKLGLRGCNIRHAGGLQPVAAVRYGLPAASWGGPAQGGWGIYRPFAAGRSGSIDLRQPGRRRKRPCGYGPASRASRSDYKHGVCRFSPVAGV